MPVSLAEATAGLLRWVVAPVDRMVLASSILVGQATVGQLLVKQAGLNPVARKGFASPNLAPTAAV